MEKSDLVVELGVEEIPASMIADATEQFANLLKESLKDQRLSPGDCTRWHTPRRIIVGFEGIPISQDDLTETVIGPPKTIAYTPEGSPTKAVHAFAQKNGVSLEKIQIISMPKGDYVALIRKVRGERTQAILEKLVPSSIAKIQFPKTMHWSPDHFRFARPLRWVVALFGGKVVRFQIADVSSSKFTFGHRFLGKSRIGVSSLASLKSSLYENFVWVDPAERMKDIQEGLLEKAAACGGQLLDDPELLQTVVNLNEAPSIVCGSFEHRFLSLPKEILITVMREHQKYFSVLDFSGELLPVFLAVVNLKSDPDKLIQSGHERVLRARLADAAFFWETDSKTRSEQREPALKNVLFQEKLGSYYDKSQRVLTLLPRLARILGRANLVQDLQTAGRLFKCDLITEMVKEFTDLQGVVGGLYARQEGYPEAVWRAVYEQYYPKSTTSKSPSSDTGAILALADRLDTVCGCFCVGLIPSGSGDPFAVRRQANGILKILLDHQLSISLDTVIRWSLSAYGKESEEITRDLKLFFEGRLRFLLEEMGYAYDCINAALATSFDNPLDALNRLRAIQELRQEADFLSLASNFKRITNILSQALEVGTDINISLLKDPAEIALYQSFLKIQPEVETARKNHDYTTALRLFASMRGVVDQFFNEVMVMAEDPVIRGNRISLLNRISQLFRSVADISRIVIEKGS